jgi:hypothetical protein
MTLSDRADDLLARKQTQNRSPRSEATSANPPGRPPLRLIPAVTQVEHPDHTPGNDHAASNELAGALARHVVTAEHPPTLAEAAGNLWLPRSEVRHGLAGQLAAATAGLVQLAGLVVCWATAHVLFATKTRAAIFALTLAVALTGLAIANHA